MLYKLAVLFFCLGIYSWSGAQTANRFDVLITELLPDPSPVVGLPNAEFIELKNVSSFAVNLLGWKLSNSNSTATVSSNFILGPDSIVIVCSNANVPLFLPFGKTLGVASFPALNNDGDVISLVSAEGKNIHAIEYNESWYGNNIKSEGGWSLEMRDTKNPCNGKSNWTASNNLIGGTPGKPNSVSAINIDDAPPGLQRSVAININTILLFFNEPLDSISASVINNYSIDNNVTIVVAKPLPPLFTTVEIKLATPLQTGIIYTVIATSITDCAGNSISAFNKTKTGLAEEAQTSDVVINEILFNPKSGASDYVELYNRSNKIIDAAALYIANRNSNGGLASAKRLAPSAFYIFPGDYIVLTEDAISLEQNYFVKNRAAIFELSSLPSFPDDEGTVVLTNVQQVVIDEVTYNDDWHFGLISNAEGVALERINPDRAAQNGNNWHSAAATAGYGTPGYVNSQYNVGGTNNATIEITPKTFSPDNDGFNDVATIYYNISESGYVANVIIYDAAGRQIRHLVKNSLLGLKGSWAWDGLGENNKKLPIGSYIIYTELFNLAGKKERFKNVVVLARKLN